MSAIWRDFPRVDLVVFTFNRTKTEIPHTERENPHLCTGKDSGGKAPTEVCFIMWL